ncbi:MULTISPECIES: hypothetical protein [unclassified Bradyrhizobium]|uniref:family 4 glycosyl hydrolase n=1 Tax=unclassified Bradyrhizobium TaxID=2631580 RepID=UPI0028EA490C|nr:MULTISPECIES: hypothetical protein [unclassified Bradyrhizobium]
MGIQVNVQHLAVEGAMHGSKELALQALLIDPVVNSEDEGIQPPSPSELTEASENSLQRSPVFFNSRKLACRR